MKYGVVYRFKSGNKINGTLFYCFEYFKFLQKYVNITFYIVDISDNDLSLVKTLFAQKYDTDLDGIVAIKTTDLYKLKLDKTLVLDIKTFNDCKEFLTNDVHCFSNEGHDMFRYKNSRTVTYYGSYHYQNFDKFCYLKLNFEIFKKFKSQPGVFISSALDLRYIQTHADRYRKQFDKPVYIKQSYVGAGHIFELIDSVHYVHTAIDTNNRIIPESFYYGKTVTIEEPIYTELDSIWLRYNDIKENGLTNYTLSADDEMVKAMLG